MPRALLVINGPVDRRRAARWVEQAPPGTRLEFRSSKRSLDQNSKFWSLLTEVAMQVEHCGRKYTPDEWKLLFMHAWGREVQFLPGLDQKSVVPVGQSSSALTKDEMSELIEFIYSWGAEHGVTFHDPETATEDKPPASDAAGRAGFPHAAGAADPSTALKIECIDKLLAIAGDATLTVRERIENLNGAEENWKQVLPHELVATVVRHALKVLEGTITKADARKYLGGLAP